jgi:D-glycero-D-manno-heptose 1,7-bisphosphate phosphatase
MYCPHRPDEHCACRKPQPGMLLDAARDLGLDLSHSYLVGDAETDMQAGQAVGCHCYMVLTGRGPRQLVPALIRGRLNFVVKWNLGAAVDAILRRGNRPEWEHPHYVLRGSGGR